MLDFIDLPTCLTLLFVISLLIAFSSKVGLINQHNFFTTWIPISGIVVLFTAIVVRKMYSNSDINLPIALNLTWGEFQANCASDSEFENRNFDQQIACARLKSTVVKWRGNIQSIKLTSVENKVENLLQTLPPYVYNFLR